MNRELENAVAETASRVTYTGSGMTMAGWVMQIDWAFWTGVVLGAVGLMINWYYKRREDIRADAIYETFARKP